MRARDNTGNFAFSQLIYKRCASLMPPETFIWKQMSIWVAKRFNSRRANYATHTFLFRRAPHSLRIKARDALSSYIVGEILCQGTPYRHATMPATDHYISHFECRRKCPVLRHGDFFVQLSDISITTIESGGWAMILEHQARALAYW